MNPAVTGSPGALRALCNDPFALLLALEKRGNAARLGGESGQIDGAELVGIGLRVGGDRLLVRRDEVREVLLPPSAITRVPGAQSWVRGLANVRGQLLPVMDLKEFLGAGPTTVARQARIIVSAAGDFPAGLLVDEVYGFRRFVSRERVTGEWPDTALRCERYLVDFYCHGGEDWPVFSLSALAASPEFQLAAAD
ncbi:MAG: purine-binding chemotaxis protein CheW [Chromatiales bacterium]|nr:purine-binding chemotaxis protein CheW [Chromatiales bacterium]